MERYGRCALVVTLRRSLGQSNLNYGQTLTTSCPLIIVIVTQWTVPQGHAYHDTLQAWIQSEFHHSDQEGRNAGETCCAVVNFVAQFVLR